MNKAYVRGTFDPFTLKDLDILKEYLAKGYDFIAVLLIDGERFEERRAMASLLLTSPEIQLGEEAEGEEIVDERLDQGLLGKDFLSLSAEQVDYAVKHCLYVAELAKRTLSDYRYHHVSCVADLSASLAEHYGLPYYKGYAAGYLHDITKEWDKTYHKEYIATKCPEYLEENEKKYHQYSARIFAKENLRITDEDILDAIGNHVNGTSEKLLSKIVFCSDKIDDSRGFDNTEIKALCFEDLPKAYEVIKERQRQHLLKKGIVHE